MTARPDIHARDGARTLSRAEFVAMIAALFATVAFSIDSMLPALPRIALELSPEAPNRAQLVLTSFVLGMGVGTLVAGPVSDAVGRKAAILGGLALYALASVAAAFAPSLETMLVARMVQGLGAAAPRIVSLAMVRDLFEGRRMAQILSFVMMIFIMVPAMAPFLGSLIIPVFGWRGVFGAFVAFALASGAWMALRQPETLPREARRPLGAGPLWRAFTEVLGHPTVRLYTAVLTLGFAQMFAVLSSIQPIYAVHLGRPETFPLWFMATALLSGAGTIVNAGLVMRLGMRRLALWAYAAQTVISGVLLALSLAGALPAAAALPVFFAWSVSIFFMAGLTFGNLNALALEPMGHIAGMASSVVGAMATVLSVAIAAPIGLAFDGTPTPLMAGTVACSALAWGLMRRAREA